jgi:DNA-binding CsgD family transcriptional regulator
MLIGIVLHRSGRDFSDRDRTLLNLLRPHLINAYQNAETRSVLTALGGVTAERGDAAVLVGALGEPLASTPRARELLPAFGDGSRHYPDRLVEWCRRMRRRAPLPVEPLVATDGDVTVEARFLTPSVIALRPLHERLEPDALGSLGLARREREVLALLTEGHTNKEIAARIHVKPATVKKHLERMYEKLGVDTRTAAAAAAFRAAALNRASNPRSSMQGVDWEVVSPNEITSVT